MGAGDDSITLVATLPNGLPRCQAILKTRKVQCDSSAKFNNNTSCGIAAHKRDTVALAVAPPTKSLVRRQSSKLANQTGNILTRMKSSFKSSTAPSGIADEVVAGKCNAIKGTQKPCNRAPQFTAIDGRDYCRSHAGKPWCKQTVIDSKTREQRHCKRNATGKGSHPEYCTQHANKLLKEKNAKVVEPEEEEAEYHQIVVNQISLTGPLHDKFKQRHTGLSAGVYAALDGLSESAVERLLKGNTALKKDGLKEGSVYIITSWEDDDVERDLNKPRPYKIGYTYQDLGKYIRGMALKDDEAYEIVASVTTNFCCAVENAAHRHFESTRMRRRPGNRNTEWFNVKLDDADCVLEKAKIVAEATIPMQR